MSEFAFGISSFNPFSQDPKTPRVQILDPDSEEQNEKGQWLTQGGWTPKPKVMAEWLNEDVLF